MIKREGMADRPLWHHGGRVFNPAGAEAVRIRFEPATGGRGTTVRVSLKYDPPGGALGALVARLFGENPDQQIDEDLRRFKQLIESGETATTTGQPSGRSATTGK